MTRPRSSLSSNSSTNSWIPLELPPQFKLHGQAEPRDLNPKVPCFPKGLLNQVHPHLTQSLSLRYSPQLRSLQVPVHSTFTKPNSQTMEAHPFATNISNFHKPSLETVLGDSPILDDFVKRHPLFKLRDDGHVHALIEGDMEHLFFPHRYSVAVDHFTYLWLLHTGELIFNTSIVGGDYCKMYLTQSSWLQDLSSADLLGIDCAFTTPLEACSRLQAVEQHELLGAL